MRAEPARERNDAFRQKRLSVPVQSGVHGQYRPCAAHAQVVATVGPERATARIKPGYSTGVMHDVSALIERQHAIIPTVEVDERSRRVKRETRGSAIRGSPLNGPSGAPSLSKLRIAP